jgi:hypothetical protein
MALIEKISGVIKNRILQGREFKERKLTVIIRLDEISTAEIETRRQMNRKETLRNKLSCQLRYKCCVFTKLTDYIQ